MFVVISLYTLDGHCYLLVGCAWSLWSLLFPADIRMVIMFPYACFVKENLYFLVNKRCAAWPTKSNIPSCCTGLLNNEAVKLGKIGVNWIRQR